MSFLKPEYLVRPYCEIERNLLSAIWYEEDGMGKPEKSSLPKNKDEGSRVDVPFLQGWEAPWSWCARVLSPDPAVLIQSGLWRFRATASS
jgi:hypothetical protein